MIAQSQIAISKMTDAQRADEFLTVLWALEWMSSSQLLGTPEIFNNVWSSRITVVEHIIVELEQQGRTDTDEYRLWVRARDHWVAKLNESLESEQKVVVQEPVSE